MNKHGSDDATTDQPARKRNWKAITGVPAAVAFTYGIAPLIFSTAAHNPNWADFWKTAATPYGTMTAGFAAIGAAGIALHNGHEQRNLDKDNADREHNAEIIRDLRTRFTTATQQLADPTTTIQQAGAYALASLADDWIERDNTQEAQVCIDVLCTYLRTHHHTSAQQQGLPHGDDYDYTDEPPDQPVRDTIIRIINNHSQNSDRPGPWSRYNYDLTGAHLDNLHLDGSHFNGDTITFEEAHFSGVDATFQSAQFTGENTLFDGAEFSCGQTSFAYAKFSGVTTVFFGAEFNSEETYFDDAQFTGDVLFGHAKFTGETTSFCGVKFAGEETVFDEVDFNSDNTSFEAAKFEGVATSFLRVEFNSLETSFGSAQFTGEKIYFDRASIQEDGTFSVDWEVDPDSQPETVTPRPWPPNLGAAATPSPSEPV